MQVDQCCRRVKRVPGPYQANGADKTEFQAYSAEVTARGDKHQTMMAIGLRLIRHGLSAHAADNPGSSKPARIH
ncbi:hypothetical protein EAM_0899 [Erwinia amylovora ATCC 49946]|nr:hypothetical protein EAM_0899 [Erwinia amylovora ATCC 49946]